MCLSQLKLYHSSLLVNEPKHFVPPWLVLAINSHSFWMHCFKGTPQLCRQVNIWRSITDDWVMSQMWLLLPSCARLPPGETMWWSAHVTSVFLLWHLSKQNHHTRFSVRRLRRVLPGLRSRRKLKHYIKKEEEGPHTLYMIPSLALALPWVNASCAQSQQAAAAHTLLSVLSRRRQQF